MAECRAGSVQSEHLPGKDNTRQMYSLQNDLPTLATGSDPSADVNRPEPNIRTKAAVPNATHRQTCAP
ncbi:hypothetical protein ZHAS_00014476 [Anopheles sinensis]|uniref:Uncharacterized protein n=1 Tax=Anopheles sinensis TaxID=74873 RepID=A0A084W8E4_ANOSI|nr:hypothetical protein ZHAS_00014476 [Anopheles sinensis]